MTSWCSSLRPMSRRTDARSRHTAPYGVWALRLTFLVWTEAEFERQAPVVTSLPAAIMREGQILYAA
jgi:hypothetical protein